jgi:hypothetical protein
LVVSELITNAVIHGRPDCDDCHHDPADLRVQGICECPCHGRTAPGVPELRLWLWSDGERVYIQVWDTSEATPVLQDAQPHEDSGRGLVLVNTISEHWGWYRPVRSTGKVVWAVVAGPGQSRWTVEVAAEPKRCDTIGCRSDAEYKISYNYRGEEEVSTDLACGPCADGYSRRPVLNNFRRIPLA